MAELFFEIFCEEIPARMQERAGTDLSKMMTDGLTKAGLSVDNVRSFTGPRRLVFVADVPTRSPDISEERKGPKVGSPEQALAGFMRAAGLSDISEAEIRTDPKKGEFYVAKIEKPGVETAAILQALIPDVLNNFPWPKSMKTGAGSFRWVRPLQRLIVLLDGTVVPVEAGDVTASNVTEGHRRHGPGPFTVSGFEDYKTQLENAGHVSLDAQARKDKILTDARAVCKAKGVELVEDIGLLNEVAGLAEWPVVILGDMDPAFLELPAEVIRLSMRTHQKYFAVRDPETGNLAPHFVVVANQDAPDGGVAIAKGNSKVLSARLADARFFQSEDAKKPLIEYYDTLDTVVFHKKLGSIRDKAERVAALARELAPAVGADPDAAEQAAKLAKCDLVTNMVIEFTSLQGQIGADMYRAEGGDAAIATAIEQHYKPQGPSDSVPTEPVAVTVALADKLDTLVGFWAIDEKPTGSKDPFALRRAALGVVRIILENGVRLDFVSLIANWYFQKIKPIFSLPNAGYGVAAFYNKEAWSVTITGDGKHAKQHYKTAFSFDDLMENRDFEVHISSHAALNSDGEPSEYQNIENYLHNEDNPREILPALSLLTKDLLTFILDRLRGDLRDKGYRNDIIDAAFAVGGDDLVAMTNRTHALQDFLLSESGTDLLAGYKRASNILKAEAKKGDLPTGAPEKLSDPLAVKLKAALDEAKTDIDAAMAAEGYAEAMTALSALRGPIDAFFDGVMVVDDDLDVRANNLRLLGMIRDTAGQIADFEAIDG